MTPSKENSPRAAADRSCLAWSPRGGRLVFYVLLQLAAFGGVCAFWRCLATGQWLDFRPIAYYQDMTTPLGAIFRHPLDVLTYPWMILVTGLMLGLLTFVPILVAVFYRPLLSVLFVLALALVGHSPVLALAVGIGCAVAGRSRIRRDMPFLAAVLGLLPAGGYFGLSALAGVDAAAVLPLQRWTLYAPFLIAFVAAVVAGAVLLGMARLVRFRAGPVWPLVVLALAAPPAIFHTEIGWDELGYALIVNRLQVGGSIFDDQALGPWLRENGGEGLNYQTARDRAIEDLDTRRDGLIDRCREFLARFPDSRRRPAILWLAAQAHSLQLDEQAFARGLIKYDTSFPLGESTPAWRVLRDSHPASSQAALADWRLGVLSLRAVADPDQADPNALVREAEEHLLRAAEALGTAVDEATERIEMLGSPTLFTSPADVPPEDTYRAANEEVEQLLWVIQQNRVLEDANSAEALAALLDLNPKLPNYFARLTALLNDKTKQRERTRMGDNLKLAVALHTPDPYERADQLIQLAKDDLTDAAIVANFELGKFALQTAGDPARVLIQDLRTPQEYFELVKKAPPNPYLRRALELLASLADRPKGRE